MGSEGKLNGKTAIVTGGAKNIGRAIALSLGGSGACVAIVTLSSTDAAREVAEDIATAGGKAIVIKADVANETDAGLIVQKTMEAFGGIDILINNASLRTHYRLQELTYERWRQVMSVNLDGPYLLARACIDHLIKSGSGRIVNIGGLSGHIGGPERTHVISSKAGLVGLTKALAAEFGLQGITSNIVVPGTIDSDWEATQERAAYPGGRGTMIGRTGLPAEVAAAVRYLVSPDAAYVTGQTIHVNGGKYLP